MRSDQAQTNMGRRIPELGKARFRRNIRRGGGRLEVAAKLKPDEAYVHYQLGRAYIQAGRKTEGESQIEISRQLKEKARSQTNQQR